MKRQPPKLDTNIQQKMGDTWKMRVSAAPFSEGKGANLPAWGYPCASCGSEQTRIQFAESSDEEESELLWMELQCRDCTTYTLYQKK
jgi:hypothetical protein